jgi:hypothetical protein
MRTEVVRSLYKVGAWCLGMARVAVCVIYALGHANGAGEADPECAATTARISLTGENVLLVA